MSAERQVIDARETFARYAIASGAPVADELLDLVNEEVLADEDGETHPASASLDLDFDLDEEDQPVPLRFKVDGEWHTIMLEPPSAQTLSQAASLGLAFRDLMAKMGKTNEEMKRRQQSEQIVKLRERYFRLLIPGITPALWARIVRKPRYMQRLDELCNSIVATGRLPRPEDDATPNA